MRFFTVSIIFVFYLSLFSYSQSDSLVIRLKNNQIDKIAISSIKSLRFENVTDVKDLVLSNTKMTIGSNYPNPFSEKTILQFSIANSGLVEIMIYDNSGKLIQILKCENCQSGNNSIEWNSIDLNNNHVNSGVYFYEVRFNNESQSKKMILIN